jgi:hypothetical protein
MHLENPRIFSEFDRECDRLPPLLPLQEVDGFHGQSLAPASPYLASDVVMDRFDPPTTTGRKTSLCHSSKKWKK